MWALLKSKSKIFVVWGFIFVLSLTSCAHKELCLEEKLAAEGVRIIREGEIITMILSSDYLFNRESANIRRCQYAVLNDVAEYIRRYQKISIIVSAYKNPTGHAPYDRALTRQQAYNVVTYLWNKGVNARIMEGIGYGDECLISNQCPYNRRVEIKFHYIPDYLHEMKGPL